MIKDGIFKQFPMEAVFGAHNWPGMPVGNCERAALIAACTSRAAVAATHMTRMRCTSEKSDVASAMVRDVKK